MRNKYSDGSLRRYIEYFVFRHVFLHEQVFMGKFVPSPLTYLPRTTKLTTKQTKTAAWWATMSLFRFGFTRKSLDTVTKSKDIQATQQLNSTKLKEPGDKRKVESQPEVFAGKSKRDRKYQTSWERDFPWLVHDEEKNTMKSRLGFMLGIKVRRHKYWKFNETASKANWWFFWGNQKIHSASKTSDIVAQRAS